MNSHREERLRGRVADLERWLADQAQEFTLERETDFDTDDRVWKVKNAEEVVAGTLRVTEGALDGRRDLKADLKRQNWLEQVKLHKRCTLRSDGVLEPGE